MNGKRVPISIIIPVHNEAPILVKQLELLLNELPPKLRAKTEIILVENGSTDASWREIRKFRALYPHCLGLKLAFASYGQAIKAGILKASGEQLFIFNVDFFDIPFLKRAHQLLRWVEIVIASKTLAASRDNRSHVRRLTTYFFNVFIRLVLNYPGTDTHGIKGFRRTELLLNTLQRCRSQNELLDTELIIRMTHAGATLTELPVTIAELRPSRYSVRRRLTATLYDLVVAFMTKYFSAPEFATKVVADDYGISNAVNRAIRAAVRRGEISIVSILANFVKPKELRKLQALPGVRFSVHFNLIEGRPISPVQMVPTLLNRDGKFYPTFWFVIRLFLGLVRPEEIQIELKAQLEKLSRQIPITHVDSHQHTHLLKPVWEGMQPLILEAGITQVRGFHSVTYYLKPKLWRYLGIHFIMLLIALRFGTVKSLTSKEDLEYITHPGTRYDHAWLRFLWPNQRVLR